MANIGKIYQDAARGGIRHQMGGVEVTDSERKDLQSLRDPPEHQSSKDAGRATLIHNWLQSTVTQELMQHLHTVCDDYINHALALAASYHQHQNHDHIISNLIRANELRNLIKKYNKLTIT